MAAELIEKLQITSAPVNLRTVVAHLGVSVQESPYRGELSGMFHRNPDGRSVIGINSTHPSNRKRFTLAHEIGHFLLHTEKDLHVDEAFPVSFRNETSSRAIDQKEIEANQFAAALLMPAVLLRRDVLKFKSDDLDEAVIELASLYEVSQQAMSIRLSSLGLIG